MKKFLFAFFMVFILAGCAETEMASHVAKKLPYPGERPSQGQFKVGNPYNVSGQWYKPRETYNFTETGIASWYGPNFHGKRTANGEIFDQNELTAAHKTLQMPSLVRVTNLENGRSLVVRVNDRGPFSKARVIDLSKRAAELLGFKTKGTAKVRIDLLSSESMALARAAKQGHDTRGMEMAMNEGRFQRQPKPIQTASAESVQPLPPEPPVQKPMEPLFLERPPAEIAGHVENGRFMPDPIVSKVQPVASNIYIQAGSFSSADNAERLATDLRRYNTVSVQIVMVNGKEFHRVRIGPLKDVRQADALLNELDQEGYHQTQIVVD